MIGLYSVSLTTKVQNPFQIAGYNEEKKVKKRIP